MDKTVRMLLAAGIAILFPVLILFASITIFPNKPPQSPPNPPSSPIYPNCSLYNVTPNATQKTYYNQDCQAKQEKYRQQAANYSTRYAQYQKDLQAFYTQQDNDQKKTTENRAMLAIAVAVVAILIGAAIRNMRELAGGLVIGSAVAILVGLGYIIDTMDSAKVDSGPIILVSFAFVVLTGVLYFLDKAMTLSLAPVAGSIAANTATQEGGASHADQSAPKEQKDVVAHGSTSASTKANSPDVLDKG